MSNGKRNVGSILPEYTVDNLGTSFKVILVDSAKRIPKENGYEIYIPDFQGLMKRIAITRAAHPLKLKSGDIKFLRKTLGLKAKDLAEKLDITAEHLSRCETGDKVLSQNSEKVLRSLVLLEAVYVLEKAVRDAGEDASSVLEKITGILGTLKEVVSGMRISPVHSADEDLVLCFKRIKKSTVDLPANDMHGPPGEWLDQPAEAA